MDTHQKLFEENILKQEVGAAIYLFKPKKQFIEYDEIVYCCSIYIQLVNFE